MSYVVTDGKTRREFLEFKDAYDFSQSMGGMNIYEVDAFGNTKQLSGEEITKKLSSVNNVNPVKNVEVVSQKSTNEASNTNTKGEYTRELNSGEEDGNIIEHSGKSASANLTGKINSGETKDKSESKAERFFKYGLLFIMILVLVIIVFFMIIPLWKRFYNLI